LATSQDLLDEDESQYGGNEELQKIRTATLLEKKRMDEDAEEDDETKKKPPVGVMRSVKHLESKLKPKKPRVKQEEVVTVADSPAASPEDLPIYSHNDFVAFQDNAVQKMFKLSLITAAVGFVAGALAYRFAFSSIAETASEVAEVV
jgi:hypothetical protein